MNALFIVGTDTNVGKTVLTTALAAYWQRYFPAQRLGIMKPIQSGAGDCELYSRLFALDPSEITPLQFQTPVAPPLAAQDENRRVELEHAWTAFELLCRTREFVLVEGVGGLGCPVTYETTVADLAWDWRLPAVLVVPVKLGAIGQAVANVALARQSRIHLKGIVLSCVQPCTDQELAYWAPAELLRSLTGVPILGCLPYLADPTDLEALAQAAANLELERLIPLSFTALVS